MKLIVFILLLVLSVQGLLADANDFNRRAGRYREILLQRPVRIAEGTQKWIEMLTPDGNWPNMVGDATGAFRQFKDGKYDALPVAWALHDGLAYIPRANEPLSFRIGLADGAGHEVNRNVPADLVKIPVFMPILKQGSNPNGRSDGFVIPRKKVEMSNYSSTGKNIRRTFQTMALRLRCHSTTQTPRSKKPNFE